MEKCTREKVNLFDRDRKSRKEHERNEEEAAAAEDDDDDEKDVLKP